MGKNTGRGGNKRKRAKNSNPVTKRELIFKEAEQEYAQVLKMQGDGRFECYCFDGTKRIANIRGQLKKRVWFQVGDIILVSLRDFQDSKCDAFWKYSPEEVKRLKALGEIPESIKLNDDAEEVTNEEVVFEYGSDDDDDGEEKKVADKKKKKEESDEEAEDDDEDEEEEEDDDDDSDDSEDEIEINNRMRMIAQKGGIQLDKRDKKGVKQETRDGDSDIDDI